MHAQLHTAPDNDDRQRSPGRSVVVDGVTYTAPINFTFTEGSQHTIAASTPAAGYFSRYRFDGWSDGGSTAHSITADPQGGKITAHFTKQVLLTVVQPPSCIWSHRC